MKTVTLNQIMNANSGIIAIVRAPLDLHTSYRFMKFSEKIDQIVERVQNAHKKLLEEYGTKEATGGYRVTTEAAMTIGDKLTAFLNETTEDIEVATISFETLERENIKLSAADLRGLVELGVVTDLQP